MKRWKFSLVTEGKCRAIERLKLIGTKIAIDGTDLMQKERKDYK